MPPTNSSTPRVFLDPITWDPKVSYDAPQSITPTLGLQLQVMTPPHLLTLEEKQALHLQVSRSRGIIYRGNYSLEPRQSLTNIITEEVTKLPSKPSIHSIEVPSSYAHVPEWESNASSSIAKSPFDIEIPSIEEFYSTPSPTETAKPVTPFPRTRGSHAASTVLSSSIKMAKHLRTSGSLDHTTKGSIKPNQRPSNITSPLSESSDSNSPLLVSITGNIPHVDTSQHVPLPSPLVISPDNSRSSSEFLPEIITFPVSQRIPIGFSTSSLQNNSANPPPTLEHTPPTRRVPTLEQTLAPSQIIPFDPLSLNSSSICNYTDTNLTSVLPIEHPSSFSLLVTTPPKKTSLNNGSAPSLPCLEDPPITNPHTGNCSSPPCDSPSRVSSHECFPPVRDIPLSVCDSLLNLHQASGWFLIWLHQINAALEWWKLPLTDAGYYSFYISAKMDAFQNYIWDDGG
eukprot:Gb_22412 [translate_table: standard]